MLSVAIPEDDFFAHSELKRTVERERDLNYDDIIPAVDRLAVPISAEVALSLVEHLSEQAFRAKASDFGWDLRRIDGGADGLGYDTFSQAVVMLDEAPDDCWRTLPDGSRTFDVQPFTDDLWRGFDRQRVPGDRLLIDIADEAVHHGWEAPPEIAASLERLREIAKVGRAAREGRSHSRKKKKARCADSDY